MKEIGNKDDQKQDGEEKEMSFLEHIEELRWHLIRSIGAIFIFGIGVFLAKDLVTEIIFAPRYNSFITHKLLCQYFNTHCEVPGFEIITRELGEEFFVHLKSSIFLAIIFTFPYLFWEIWRFVKPGLYDKERKAARGIVFVCSSLFFLGVLFGYFIIAPFSISFLAGYSFGEGNADTATLGSYVGYITMITLPTGLVFELPIVAYFLGKVGLISSGLMKTFRRHAIVVIFILAAVITPPDLMTQLLIAVPLIGLYEVSISIVKRLEKKHEKEFGSSSK